MRGLECLGLFLIVLLVGLVSSYFVYRWICPEKIRKWGDS
jgi:hypothetical protein